MAKPQLWQLGVLVFAFIACSQCCMLSKSLECPMSGASFGGRLKLVTDGAPHSAMSSPLLNRGRMIIFQTPPAHFRTQMRSGRGKIWIGSRTCQGSGSQPGYCPWTGDRPCLDARIPCETEPPSYIQSDPLEFSSVSRDSCTVHWPAWDETTDLGVGPITGHKILYRQLGGIFQEVLLDGNSFSHRFDSLTGSTTYEFVIVLVRDGEPIEGQPSQIQTVTTKPAKCTELGHVNLDVETRAGPQASFLIVSWELPSLTESCNLDHQEITLRQRDVDGCPRQTRFTETAVIGIDQRMKRFRQLSYNSLYDITYLSRNPAGPYETSRTLRTAESVPSGGPTGLRDVTNINKIQFSWSKPPCGERNGEIIRYEYVASKNGNPRSGERMPAQARYQMRQLSYRDRWLFKVRACTRAGCGPYAQTSGTMD